MGATRLSVYEFGPFRLDAKRLSLAHDGQALALGRKVVETMLALVERPGEALPKDLLLDRVWPEGFVEEANLAQNIYVLRRTFRAYGIPNPIETVPRYGYRFTARVRRLVDTPHVRGAKRQMLSHRIAAAAAGALIVAASVMLVASYRQGQRDAAARLSDSGARAYQVGRYYWNLRTRDGVRRSLNYFTQVIDTDPGDARGYAALAEANVMMGDYCYGTHAPAVYFARAGEYAKKAIAIDPDSVEAHAALGILALDRRDTTTAVAELQRAIALDPSYGPAQEWYGIALLGSGRSAEAVAHLKIAADLDPLSVATTAWLGSAALVERRYDDAIAYSRQALELSPRRVDVLSTLGKAYEARGDVDLAIETFKRFAVLDPYYRPEAAALLAHAYAVTHRISEARAQFAYALAHANEVLDPDDFRAAAAAVGDASVQYEKRTRHSAMFA